MTKPFDIDIKAIKDLAAILEDTSLSEIEYELNGQRIKLKKQRLSPSVMMPTSAQQPISPAPATIEVAVSKENGPGSLKSPMVGTLYSSSSPGAAPFVSKGSTVSAGDPVCIIEAMKVMNPVRAHRSGTVREIFFQDASPVEFDDVLMIID